MNRPASPIREVNGPSGQDGHSAGIYCFELIRTIIYFSASCGAGVKRRTRFCRSGNCPGNYKESAICNERDCENRNANWGGKLTICICTKCLTDTNQGENFPNENEI